MVAGLVPLQKFQEKRKKHIWQQDTNLAKFQPRHYKRFTIRKHHLVAWEW